MCPNLPLAVLSFRPKPATSLRCRTTGSISGGFRGVWLRAVALFAVLLAFDGLIRERASGAVLFSLGLPVSRKRWLFTRLAAVLMESASLSLFAVLVIIAGSAVIHQTFSLSQVFLHAALMVAAGVFVVAFGNLCYTLFPSNYLSLLIPIPRARDSTAIAVKVRLASSMRMP
jgi:ABC-type transport system involved in multi-copper enzyme maturation permease subunit